MSGHVTCGDDSDDRIGKFLPTQYAYLLSKTLVLIVLDSPTFPTHTRARYGVLVSRHGVLHRWTATGLITC